MVQVHVDEVCFGEDRADKVRPNEFHTAQISAAEVRADNVGAGEVRLVEVKRSAGDVVLCIPAPDHSDGGLDVVPCPSVRPAPVVWRRPLLA